MWLGVGKRLRLQLAIWQIEQHVINIQNASLYGDMFRFNSSDPTYVLNSGNGKGGCLLPGLH